MNPVGKPCEGEPHARFDEGGLETRLDSGNRLVCGQPPREAPSCWCASPPLYKAKSARSAVAANLEGSGIPMPLLRMMMVVGVASRCHDAVRNGMGMTLPRIGMPLPRMRDLQTWHPDATSDAAATVYQFVDAASQCRINGRRQHERPGASLRTRYDLSHDDHHPAPRADLFQCCARPGRARGHCLLRV